MSTARKLDTYEHGPLSQYVTEDRMTPSLCATLRQALRSAQTVLVSGPAHSGKTTLLNTLLSELSSQCPSESVLVLERKRELDCRGRKATPLLVSGGVSAAELLRSALRLHPDRLVMGELLGAEALGAVKAWSGAQPGGLATICSPSARQALARLEQLAAQGTLGFVPRAEISEALGLIVHLAQGRDGPVVEQVIRVRGLDGCGQYMLEEVQP